MRVGVGGDGDVGGHGYVCWMGEGGVSFFEGLVAGSFGLVMVVDEKHLTQSVSLG